MRRNIEFKPEYIFIAYLIGVVISYGHSYWKFNPCESESERGMAGVTAGLSSMMWPFYVSYIAFSPRDYQCVKEQGK